MNYLNHYLFLLLHLLSWNLWLGLLVIRYAWFLWSLHKDHHNQNLASWWERNDLFFVFYAVISMSFFYSQSNLDSYGFAVGFGIMAYGLTYFIVHDIFIHQRFKILRNASNWYAKGIRKAHKMHHANLKKMVVKVSECYFPQ